MQSTCSVMYSLKPRLSFPVVDTGFLEGGFCYSIVREGNPRNPPKSATASSLRKRAWVDLIA